ncbi:MAG TPA: tRNA 2-thiouridine(34) synthase MnmA [Phycisphaerae bacterium]|jgi:tRNA-specific 2-thiouridylase
MSHKVVVAMSGGVDSSVAAGLLCEQGYDVVGLFMRTGVSAPAAPEEPNAGRHQGCCSASDAADARFVAGQLGIPFYALNFEQEFGTLIDYFADEYSHGRTPNPCVVCNNKLKFGRLVEYADAVGADYIATGHYARIDRSHGAPRLLRGIDARKDQSYVLFGIQRGVLDRMLLPIGDLAKPEVRARARRLGLPNADKPDSVEICFVPDRDYARVVRERRPEAFRPGKIVAGDGVVMGAHAGIGHYTIGQRHGLGIAAGRPVYVTAINVADRTITIGDRHELLCAGLVADRCNYLADVPHGEFRAEVKIRYLHRAAPATIESRGAGSTRTARVIFDEPQPAITPGQAAVFYDGDLVLGGGWIERSLPGSQPPA